ncbi:MAG: VCBS repeat-containing protein [Bifidobacterium psychraerophilum]|uniref:FG-GAP repeat domain-containing protein n=1 Tax=Bifidobacterium psychraerophilum TaxID=218140 RepID=UPI0039E86BB1
MTATEVQTFLNKEVPVCHPEYDSDPSSIVCLKDYKTSSVSKTADSYCAGYSGGKTQSAAQIIDGVARSCGVSQEVLLVLLQKENGLVTHTWPSPWRYKTAMGYGCPDTAACDSQYYGFFNQVYNAARQYKLYKASPSSYQYRIGSNTIYWSPTLSCGSSVVVIKNQATAGLYNYTPYRPNQAALDAGYGSGNSCSSYGNRNFYLYYSDWFGDPTTEATPRNDGRTYYFKNSLSGGDADTVVKYGLATDIAYVGDWDGNGTDTLALRRGNIYYFKNSLTAGSADKEIAYGNASDVVLVGDWNGDGTDTLAVRRGNLYYFKNSISGGAADTVIAYGKATDSVLVGDWNGDGKDTLAVRRGSTYYFKNSISGGAADSVIAYGQVGDTVLVGDWNGDKIDTLAVRRGNLYYFKNSISGGAADSVVGYGSANDTVLVGDWNGDGTDTLAVRR